MDRPYDIPTLGDLACFESAARHLSFKLASTELNVTPAAVSHRIKALETELGRMLFTRQYRGVQLTEAGALLFVSLQRGFEDISDTVARIRSRRDRTGVTIAATSAMSGLWLTPRLAAFWKVHPGVAISQIIQDTGQTAGADLTLTYGDPSRADGDTYMLFHDRILALGTQTFAESYGISSIKDMADKPLIHTQSAGNDWTSWNDWFSHFGHPLPEGPGFTLNNYLISLRAAEDHIGAVLGWEGLVKNHLESGRLVQLVPEAMASPWPFYLHVHAQASASARAFAGWLVELSQ